MVICLCAYFLSTGKFLHISSFWELGQTLATMLPLYRWSASIQNAKFHQYLNLNDSYEEKHLKGHWIRIVRKCSPFCHAIQRSTVLSGGWLNAKLSLLKPKWKTGIFYTFQRTLRSWQYSNKALSCKCWSVKNCFLLTIYSLSPVRI